MGMVKERGEERKEGERNGVQQQERKVRIDPADWWLVLCSSSAL